MNQDIVLAICGKGQAGKTSVCKWLHENFGCLYEQSTSEVAAEAVFKMWGKDHYSTAAACWADRRNHRVTWGALIREYNHYGTRLYREMLPKNHLLDGIRKGDELYLCQTGPPVLVHLSIWIDRNVPDDPSLDYGPEACDIVIPNNSTLEDLFTRCLRLVWLFK